MAIVHIHIGSAKCSVAEIFASFCRPIRDNYAHSNPDRHQVTNSVLFQGHMISQSQCIPRGAYQINLPYIVYPKSSTEKTHTCPRRSSPAVNFYPGFLQLNYCFGLKLMRDGIIDRPVRLLCRS